MRKRFFVSVSSLVLAVSPAFAASQDVPATINGPHTFLGPVTLPPATALTSPVISGGLTQNGVVIDVRAPPYNAKCDGTTGDATAINAALSAAPNNAAVLIPDATCRAESTITEPPGVNLVGTVFNPGNPPTGSTIKCDVGVSPCVTGGGNNGQARFEKLIISHSGSPGAGVIGLQVSDAYNAVLSDVMVYNAGVCYQFLAHPSTGRGLGAVVTRGYSGNCSDTHIDDNGWPELRISQSRFGMNGGQSTSNTFIRFEGGVGGTAGGPNTFDAENTQFNAPAVHFAEFVNLGSAGVPSIDATDFKFQGLHVEGVTGADFYSDASWNILNRVNVANSSFNDNGTPFLALNAATQISVFQLNMDQIYGSLSFTGQVGLPISAFTQIGGFMNGAETLTGSASSTATIAGVAFNAGLTVAGPWASLSVGPDIYVNGNITNTATGYVNIFEPTYFSWSAPIVDNTSGQQTLEYLNGVVPGNYVQQVILNNSSAANSSARTQWETSGAGVYAIFGVSEAGGSPAGGFTAGSGVTGPMDFLSNSPTAFWTFHPDGVLALSLTPSAVIASLPVQVPTYTVSTLPTCSGSLSGSVAYVTDATAPAYNSTLVGGGTVKTLAMCNASVWAAH